MTARYATLNSWHERDIAATRRHLAVLRRLRATGGEPRELEAAEALLDAPDLADAFREARELDPTAHRRWLHAATGRALDVAEAGGDGLGDPPDPAWVAERRAAWVREGAALGVTA